MITKEGFEEWKANPLTIEILEKVSETKEGLEEHLAAGGTLGPTADETHGLTSRMVGHIEGLNQILNIEFKDGEE